MGSQRLGSCSGTLNCIWHLLPCSCAGNVDWSRNVQAFPFLLLSNFSTCSFAWLKPERQLRSLGMHLQGAAPPCFRAASGRGELIWEQRASQPPLPIVNLLGSSTMEENTCVLWGGVRRRGGLKLREILFFPARRVEVYAGLILSFQTKISYSTGIYFTDFNKHQNLPSVQMSLSKTIPNDQQQIQFYSKIYKQPNGLIKLYSKVTLK